LFLCSCGDGSLGEPPKRGDGQCGNMRLLLRQQQRVSHSEKLTVICTNIIDMFWKKFSVFPFFMFHSSDPLGKIWCCWMGSLFKGITACICFHVLHYLCTSSVQWIWWCDFRNPSTKMIILENILVNWSLIEKQISVGRFTTVPIHHSFLTWMIRQVIVNYYKIDNSMCKNIIIMSSFEIKFTSCSKWLLFDNWALEWWYLTWRTKLV